MQKTSNFLKMLGIGALALICVACQPIYVQDGHGSGMGWSMEWGGGIRTRVDRAMANIDHGVYRGSLTESEATKLRYQLRLVLLKIDRAQRDGYLNHEDRIRIDKDLDKLERNIYKENYDREFQRR